MSAIDLEMIRGRLDNINENTKLLNEIETKASSAASYDPVSKAATERLLQVSIEAVLDVANHLIAALRLRKPERYADAPSILKDAGVINASLTTKLEEMIRFRNLLVSAYAKVDPSRLREFIRSNLADFESFKTEITKFLSRTKTTPT